MRILVDDDEPALLEQAGIFLPRENSDLSVKTTTSGEEALQMVRSGNFDAVVSDYLLPNLDGIEILRKLREEGNGTPVHHDYRAGRSRSQSIFPRKRCRQVL